MESIDILKIIAAILALIVGIVGHEIMHGWVAYKYGDNTAKNAGRLSINPLIHVDLIGTIIVPATLYFLPMLFGSDSGILFGWAKPVPVNQSIVIQNGGYNAAMQVSLAGIVYNFVVAVLASIMLLNLAQPTNADSMVYLFTYIFVFKLLLINVVLAVFNLLPIPQFDGAH
ncbi:MAG: site-2 protease family protein, partial [Campylobacterota bacterium]|nr:site-2 protease family protein [Campylobacterota bacterium]